MTLRNGMRRAARRFGRGFPFSWRTLVEAAGGCLLVAAASFVHVAVALAVAALLLIAFANFGGGIEFEEQEEVGDATGVE